jgi:hypothetical protein
MVTKALNIIGFAEGLLLGSDPRLIDIKSLSRRHLIQKISTPPLVIVLHGRLLKGKASIKIFKTPVLDKWGRAIKPFTISYLTKVIGTSES